MSRTITIQLLILMAFNLGAAFANIASLPVNAVRGVGRAVFGPGHRPLREMGAGMQRAFASAPGFSENRSRMRRPTPQEEAGLMQRQRRSPAPEPAFMPQAPTAPKPPAAPGPVTQASSKRTPGAFYDGSLSEGRAGQVTVNGNTYEFISGGHKRGFIPEGQYDVSGPRLRNDPGFAVGDFGFSFDLEDRYDKRVGDERTALRIHPDGGKCGTAGCVGIQGDEKVQRQFYADMRKQLENGQAKIDVRYYDNATDYTKPKRRTADATTNPFLIDPIQ